jgi:predicted GNAT family N-acyltransferase
MNVQYHVVSSFEDLQKSFFVRGVVFIEEQKCLYADEFDGNEYSSTNFIATIVDEPIATARVRFSNGYAKVERLAVRKAYRGKKIGKGLFDYILKYVDELGYRKIVIHAQAYLLVFYESIGFVKIGDMFVEAGIEHYYMEKNINIG